MRKYIMQFENGTATIPWEYAFEMTSDKMALEYAQKIVENDPAAGAARSVLLFTTEPDATDALLARFESVTTVKNTHRSV